MGAKSLADLKPNTPKNVFRWVHCPVLSSSFWFCKCNHWLNVILLFLMENCIGIIDINMSCNLEIIWRFIFCHLSLIQSLRDNVSLVLAGIYSLSFRLHAYIYIYKYKYIWFIEKDITDDHVIIAVLNNYCKTVTYTDYLPTICFSASHNFWRQAHFRSFLFIF